MNTQGIRIEFIDFSRTASKIENLVKSLKLFCIKHYNHVNHKIQKSAFCFKVRRLLKKFNAQNIKLNIHGNDIQFHYTLTDRVALMYDELAQIQHLITHNKETNPELKNVRVIKMFDSCTMYIKFPITI